ncbi:hypothetical protein LL254_10265 [Marinobacter nauticus]|uniref:hypothetical protein n=1 Tax=Marinobacter nauticus TaxID=2743 RepID=UPI001D184E20|nr:hypothetical protein [Marinobacter nauticus]MCC4271095.1 hypothetical protein [Marinobacter nauticus]
MIKEDVPVPAATEFMEALNSGNHLKLIREWGDVLFHTVFIREHPGLELPMLYSVDDHHSFLASPDADEVQEALLERLVLGEDADVFVRAVPLRELARNAHMLGAWLNWFDAKIIMDSSLMELLGMKALVTLDDGQERLYQAKVYASPALNKSGTSANVSAQIWKVSDIEGGAGLQRTREFFVYDDSKSFAFAENEGSILSSCKLSQLRAKEAMLFGTWASPVYNFEAVTKDAVREADYLVEDTYVPHPSLLDEALLDSFRELERAINNEIMPDARRLHLDVSKGQVFAELEEPGDDEMDRVEGRKFCIVFDDHPEWCLWLGGDGLAVTDYSDEVWLPESPGRHEVPESLRLKIVRAIAWMLFWKGREPGSRVSLIPGQFAGLRPFRPDNLDRIFHPPLDDSRFPALASMPCGEQPLPVLVHGELPEGYVVEALEDLQVSAAELPRGTLRRDSLLLNGAVHFGSMCGPIVVPQTAIEFPDEWYTGIRTSNTQLISDLKAFLWDQSRVVPAPEKDPDDPGAVIGICLGIMAFLLVLVLVLG